MRKLSTKPSDRLTWPLCRSYLFVQVEAVAVHIATAGDVRFERTLSWALGVLPGGDTEVLGVWSEPDAHQSALEHGLGDLKLRGVELIKFVAASEPALRAIQASFPQAAVLYPTHAKEAVAGMFLAGERRASSRWMPVQERSTKDQRRRDGGQEASALSLDSLDASERLGGESSESTSMRPLAACSLRPVRSTLEAARRLQHAVDRSVRRHGAFTDSGNAIDFVATILLSALRSHWNQAAISGSFSHGEGTRRDVDRAARASPP